VDIILTTTKPWFYIPTLCIFPYFTHLSYCHGQMPIKTMLHFLRLHIPGFKFSWNLCFIFPAPTTACIQFYVWQFSSQNFYLHLARHSEISKKSRPTKRWHSWHSSCINDSRFERNRHKFKFINHRQLWSAVRQSTKFQIRTNSTLCSLFSHVRTVHLDIIKVLFIHQLMHKWVV